MTKHDKEFKLMCIFIESQLEGSLAVIWFNFLLKTDLAIQDGVVVPTALSLWLKYLPLLLGT